MRCKDPLLLPLLRVVQPYPQVAPPPHPRRQPPPPPPHPPPPRPTAPQHLRQRRVRPGILRIARDQPPQRPRRPLDSFRSPRGVRQRPPDHFLPRLCHTRPSACTPVPSSSVFGTRCSPTPY